MMVEDRAVQVAPSINHNHSHASLLLTIYQHQDQQQHEDLNESSVKENATEGDVFRQMSPGPMSASPPSPLPSQPMPHVVPPQTADNDPRNLCETEAGRALLADASICNTLSPPIDNTDLLRLCETEAGRALIPSICDTLVAQPPPSKFVTMELIMTVTGWWIQMMQIVRQQTAGSKTTFESTC